MKLLNYKSGCGTWTPNFCKCKVLSVSADKSDPVVQ